MGTTHRILGALLFVLFFGMLAVAIVVSGGMPVHGFPGGIISLLVLLWMVLPLALVLGLAIVLIRVFSGSDDPAMEELRAAYARGELTDEEFEHRREMLRND